MHNAMHTTHHIQKKPTHTACPAHVRLILTGVDDHAYQQRLAFFNTIGGIEVVATAHTGLDAITQTQHFIPDIVLLDADLPTINGFKAAQRIKKLAPHTRILILSDDLTPRTYMIAYQAGAQDVVYKETPNAKLLKALCTVCNIAPDETFVSPTPAPPHIQARSFYKESPNVMAKQS